MAYKLKEDIFVQKVMKLKIGKHVWENMTLANTKTN